MLKLMMDDEFNIEIAANDRGLWEKISGPRSCAATFQGFGGENEVTVHMMGMQNGVVDFLVVHSSVDSPVRFVQAEIQVAREDRFNPDIYSDKINELLAQIMNYPETLW